MGGLRLKKQQRLAYAMSGPGMHRRKPRPFGSWDTMRERGLWSLSPRNSSVVSHSANPRVRPGQISQWTRTCCSACIADIHEG